MTEKTQKFKVFKKVLKNGLTVLARPSHHIPRVDSLLWYDVGAKDEGRDEKGAAHFIEHMLFKGTKNLSETDINAISYKLTGHANAFTSLDTTCFLFKFPSAVWHESLSLFAECMQNALFKEQIMASELKTIVEELRMYRDDYQSYVLENLISMLWPEHPYCTPIIGTTQSLSGLNHQTLYNFYKKHYHPTRATLVVVGDVEPDSVFAMAEKYLEKIPSGPKHTRAFVKFNEDVSSKQITLYRDVKTPWCCYVYQIPGVQAGKNYAFDIAGLVLGNSKSSRLYERLVNKDQLAADVDCFVCDFFERGLFCISVYPLSIESIPAIERALQEEITRLSTTVIDDIEFLIAQKKTQFDYLSLYEYTEKQAFLIGNYYLALGDEHFLNTYKDKIARVKKQDVLKFFKTYCVSSCQHRGYLLPASKDDSVRLSKIQKNTQELENNLLEAHVRTSPLEGSLWAKNIALAPLQKFSYPKPTVQTLENKLDVVYSDNPSTDTVAILLNFKATALNDSKQKTGLFLFLVRLLCDGTARYSSYEFSKLLESEGVYLNQAGECIAIRCASENLEKGLSILYQVLTEPNFDDNAIERFRAQINNELQEFWDAPLDFIDQVTKEYMYKDHPYAKCSFGTYETIKSITRKDLKDCFARYITPCGASLIIVGGIGRYNIPALVKKYLGAWTGSCVSDFKYPDIVWPQSQEIHVPLKRDQVVIAFAAPSIKRLSKEFNLLALADIVLTGGASAAAHSRLFELREKSGLFYAVGGSLLYNAREDNGLVLIKTIVSLENVSRAKKLILETIDTFAQTGISAEEFIMAKNLFLASSVELFESNMNRAQTFLFLKRYKLSFNLFDKQGDLLSIIKINDVNEIAKRYCDKKRISIITVGRSN